MGRGSGTAVCLRELPFLCRVPALAGAADIKNAAASSKAQRPRTRIAEATAPGKRFSIARVTPPASYLDAVAGREDALERLGGSVRTGTRSVKVKVTQDRWYKKNRYGQKSTWSHSKRHWCGAVSTFEISNSG